MHFEQLFTVKRPHFTSPRTTAFTAIGYSTITRLTYRTNKTERGINRKCVIAQPISGFHLITKYLVNTNAIPKRIYLEMGGRAEETSETGTNKSRVSERLKCPAAIFKCNVCDSSPSLFLPLSTLSKHSKSSSGNGETAAYFTRTFARRDFNSREWKKKEDHSGKVRWSNFLRHAPSIRPPG